jgi:hypothetical protein
MAEVTIRLRHNARTGERELVIHYESESDALPHEHERDHRAWAEALLGRPLGELVGGAIDRVIVERAPVAGAQTQEQEAAPTPAAERNRG